MMYLYDESLTAKLKNVFLNTIYAPVDKVFKEYLKDTSNLEIKMPLVSLYRSSFQMDPTSFTELFRGRASKYTTTEKDSLEVLKGISLTLNYQIDIWGKTDKQRDDLLKELLFFLLTSPEFSVTLGTKSYTFYLNVQPPEDNTDLSSFEDTGEYYRVSIPATVDCRLVNVYDVQTVKYLLVSTEVSS